MPSWPIGSTLEPSLILMPDTIMSVHRRLPVVLFALFMSCGSATAQPATVYTSLSVSDVTPADLSARVADAGWHVLGEWDAAVPEGCTASAHVMAAVHPDAAEKLTATNAFTAPFALVDRWALIRDEAGVHIVLLNPTSIWSTVLVDAPEARTNGAAHAEQLRQSMPDVSPVPTGQARSRGLIGKTMGVMAGGSFDGRISVLHNQPDLDLSAALQMLEADFGNDPMTWDLKIRYVHAPSGADWAVVGISGAPMERRSFEIVGRGNRDDADGLACPGIDHAAAYPIELLIREKDNGIDVLGVDAMYRMKMFFEDAGKWAFMKNMGMPGSIASEIGLRLEAALSEN